MNKDQKIRELVRRFLEDQRTIGLLPAEEDEQKGMKEQRTEYFVEQVWKVFK